MAELMPAIIYLNARFKSCLSEAKRGLLKADGFVSPYRFTRHFKTPITPCQEVQNLTEAFEFRDASAENFKLKLSISHLHRWQRRFVVEPSLSN